MDWTEVHRPQSLDDIVGNGPARKELKQWAAAWAEGIPEVRALILAGPPGVGKTSAALALARDMGWSAVELNASDARNADVIKRVATAGALNQTFGGDGSFRGESGRKLIILDEADNLYERLDKESAGSDSSLSDRGGKRQIIDTVKQTRQPIVLIVNDLYALKKGSGSALGRLAKTVKFQRVNIRSIPKALAEIAAKEEVRVDREVLETIAARASGDLRAAVRDLESLCRGRLVVTAKELPSLGYRDSSGNLFDAVRHILKGRDAEALRREVRNLDATPEDLVLWVDENLAKEYQHPEDLVRGYHMLAAADRFLGRARRTQNYRLWAYASDLATVGVASARQHQYKKFVPFGFPQYLSKMSRSRSKRQAKQALADALGRATHQSRHKALMEQVQVFEALFASDREFAAHMTHELELSDDQVSLLLGEGVAARDVKAIRQAADQLALEAPRKQEDSGAFSAFEDPKIGNEVEEEQEASPEKEDDAGRRSERPKPGAGQQSLF